ncbi:hypothetical protein ATANTOWER_001535 [Ataeniobius toweri]|uniref:Uncharacterized protein n=1 Tax=Ataeniobius toweri TaxID=208326 RepID=A0ABU7ALI1_9TELE|nr:hypothetical protein [Ataeniobius toweri]
MMQQNPVETQIKQQICVCCWMLMKRKLCIPLRAKKSELPEAFHVDIWYYHKHFMYPKGNWRKDFSKFSLASNSSFFPLTVISLLSIHHFPLLVYPSFNHPLDPIPPLLTSDSLSRLLSKNKLRFLVLGINHATGLTSHLH